ncbi:MAG: hypothetical protein Kow0026_16640 [Oricola sp.]
MAQTAKRRTRPTRVNGNLTREKILDAAEALFGERGYASVSLRDITNGADVTLALATYHFGTKENLFEEVVARRADILCRAREERLAALASPDIRAILDAFMAPLFEKATSGEPGWSHYFRVLARLGEGDQWLDLLVRHFDGTANAFLDALVGAMPKADRGEVARAFTMMLQVMLATVSRHGRVDRLTRGSVRANDLQRAYPVLLQFVTAGMESFNR